MAGGPIPRFKIYQREHKTYLLTFKDPDLVDDDKTSATYNPLGLVDLSGATIHYRWKKNVGDADPAIIAKTTPSEIVISTQTPLPWTSASTRGEAKVFLVPNDTDPTVNVELLKLTTKHGTFFFDAWVILGGEQKVVIPPSPIDLLETVTDL